MSPQTTDRFLLADLDDVVSEVGLRGRGSRRCSFQRRSTAGSGISPSTASTTRWLNSSSGDGRTSSSATSSPSRWVSGAH